MSLSRLITFFCQGALLWGCVAQATAQLPNRSSLAVNTEPGAMYLEDILPHPVRLKVAVPSVIYYQADMQRPLGAMAPGTIVQLVAMTDTAYKVRGRARHGDVAGWMRQKDLTSPDPKLAENLKKFFDRSIQVEGLIKNKQVAIGMTAGEVKASLGEPQRKSAKVTAEGRNDVYEYITYKMVPQVGMGRDSFGNLVQTTIMVKVESGRLSIELKGGAVVAIEEVQGNPLGNGGVTTVPPPITNF